MKPSAIIDHTSPASTQTQKPSLPISRSNGPGYERPERARTSHACEPCRERKTKCDGERPSCRRCLHTGTTCHYGYGKGWRKRKTAEDLNVTSKKLQRYEALLNDIIPMVPPDVRAMIDEVRQHIGTPPNSASETNESATSSVSSSLAPSLNPDRERSGSGPTSRLPLTLPMPGTLLPHQQRSQPPLPFDRVSESTSPRLAHHSKSDGGFEDLSHNRLPSITPNGLLIESNLRDESTSFLRPTLSNGSTVSDHFSSAAGSSNGPVSPKKYADEGIRSSTSPTFRLNRTPYLPQSHASIMTHLTA